MGRPTGTDHFRWNGGRKHNSAGYIEVLRPGHPMASRNYVYEHRLVMAEHLGRMLTPEEHVHHINENKSDNRIENLQLTTNTEHRSLHRGRKHSDETKKKIGAYSSNRPAEVRKKISDGQKGRVVSDETRRRISAAKRGKKTRPCPPGLREKLRRLALERHAAKSRYRRSHMSSPDNK